MCKIFYLFSTSLFFPRHCVSCVLYVAFPARFTYAFPLSLPPSLPPSLPCFLLLMLFQCSSFFYGLFTSPYIYFSFFVLDVPLAPPDARPNRGTLCRPADGGGRGGLPTFSATPSGGPMGHPACGDRRDFGRFRRRGYGQRARGELTHSAAYRDGCFRRFTHMRSSILPHLIQKESFREELL